MDLQQDLYQELILDHNKRPRNAGKLESPNRSANGYNPLCGDRITVQLEMDGDTVSDIRFEGSGCAISTASASLMTDSVKGKSTAEVTALFEKFHNLITDEGSAGETGPDLGKLKVFAGVGKYPARVKCATLAWHTVKAALDGHLDEPVSTE